MDSYERRLRKYIQAKKSADTAPMAELIKIRDESQAILDEINGVLDERDSHGNSDDDFASLQEEFGTFLNSRTT